MDWPFCLYRPQSGRCHLLELPPELREAIYAFALVSYKPTVTFKLDRYQQDTYTQANQPPLTRVSRQIRQETLPVWYGGNDIVLHAEGGKADDARKWLVRHEQHLPKLRQVSFWIRYVTPANRYSSSNGAIAVRLRRDPGRGGAWRVEDGWRWITVVRKPEEVARDAKFLVGHLRELLREDWPDQLSAAGLHGLLADLRVGYVRQKMGRHPI